jgi:hypothetical protein
MVKEIEVYLEDIINGATRAPDNWANQTGVIINH